MADGKIVQDVKTGNDASVLDDTMEVDEWKKLFLFIERN